MVKIKIIAPKKLAWKTVKLSPKQPSIIKIPKKVNV